MAKLFQKDSAFSDLPSNGSGGTPSIFLGFGAAMAGGTMGGAAFWGGAGCTGAAMTGCLTGVGEAALGTVVGACATVTGVG